MTLKSLRQLFAPKIKLEEILNLPVQILDRNYQKEKQAQTLTPREVRLITRYGFKSDFRKIYEINGSLYSFHTKSFVNSKLKREIMEKYGLTSERFEMMYNAWKYREELSKK